MSRSLTLEFQLKSLTHFNRLKVLLELQFICLLRDWNQSNTICPVISEAWELLQFNVQLEKCPLKSEIFVCEGYFGSIEPINIWTTIVKGKPLRLNKEIYQKTFCSLIHAMLKKNPNNRKSAEYFLVTILIPLS